MNEAAARTVRARTVDGESPTELALELFRWSEGQYNREREKKSGRRKKLTLGCLEIERCSSRP